MNRELYNFEHRHRRLIAWLLIYGLVACSFFGYLYYTASRIRTQTLPVGQIELGVSHSKYVVGEPVIFVIKNNLNSDAYVINECPGEPLNVYVKRNDTWQIIHDTASLKECPKEDRKVKLAPNTSLSGSFKAWPNLFKEPGLYRIVAVVEHYNSLPYQDFEIVAAATPAMTAPQNTQSQTTTPSANSTTQTHSKEIFYEEDDD